MYWTADFSPLEIPYRLCGLKSAVQYTVRLPSALIATTTTP